MLLPCAPCKDELDFTSEQDAGFINFYFDFSLQADKLMKFPNKKLII